MYESRRRTGSTGGGATGSGKGSGVAAFSDALRVEQRELVVLFDRRHDLHGLGRVASSCDAESRLAALDLAVPGSPSSSSRGAASPSNWP